MSEHQTRDTSLLSFIELIENPIHLGHLETIVYEAIRDNPLLCDEELAELTGLKVCCICGRRNKLEEMKLIESAGKKKSKSNRLVHSWRVKQ